MKTVMYHYVREADSALPWLRFLHIDDFCKQLDYFAETYGFVDQDGYERALATGVSPEGVLLTFDDNLNDHWRHVRPELLKRGIWGLFFITGLPYYNNKLLDVHRIHVLLGAYGGETILRNLNLLVTDDMLLADAKEKFSTSTYTRQDNDSATNATKRLINYFLHPNSRSKILDQLMAEYYPDEAGFCSSFYLSGDEIRTMASEGFGVCGHAYTHTLLSNLPVAQQRQEIVQSVQLVADLSGGRAYPSFCYPYGGAASYTSHVHEELTKLGIASAFSVESRDVFSTDLTENPLVLPRYDCNEFPHGRAYEIGLPDYRR